MKVYIKNKIFSLKGSSTVKNENGEDVFIVKGKFFSITRKKFICDLDGKVLYKVRNRWFNWIAHCAYIYDENNTKIARVKKPLFSIKKHIVQGYKDEITLEGNLFSLKSTIIRNGNPIGAITREVNIMTDAFCLEASPEDMPFMIALVICKDNISDDKAND